MTTGVNLSIKQVAADLGIHTNVLSRWCREDAQQDHQTFQGQGGPWDEEMARLKRKFARVKQERDF
jgi:transposase